MSKADKKYEGSIYDINSPLTLAALRRAANALTRLETRPQIAALRGNQRMIRRQKRRDLQGLARLQSRNIKKTNQDYRYLDNQMAQHTNYLVGQRDQAVARDKALTNESAGRMAAINDEATGGVLASQLAGGRGAGLADAALAQQQIARTADQSVMAQAAGEYTDQMGQAAVNASRSARANEQRARAEAKSNIRNAIASRTMDTRNQYFDAMMANQDELKTARSLKGAARVKNLLALRDAEKKSANERLALLLDAKANNQDYKLALKELGFKYWDNEKGDDDDGGGGGSGGSGSDGDTPGRMTKPEWRDWRAIANQERDGGPIAPGTWNTFLDEMADDRNVDWTGRERNQFRKRYGQWYQNNTDF